MAHSDHTPGDGPADRPGDGHAQAPQAPPADDGARPAETLDSTSALPRPQLDEERSLPAASDNGAVTLPDTPAGPPPRRPRYSIRTFESLADPNYRWYFVSMFGWFAGMNMQMFIRGYMVFELTNSYAALGIVSLSQAVPGLLFSFTGGVLADRVRSKKLLVQAMTTVNVLNVLAVAILLAAGRLEVWHLYVNAAVQGATQSNMMPARQVLTSEVVGLQRLMNALALNNAGMNLNRMAMPAVGGALLVVVGGGVGINGAEYIYFLMAALFAVAVLALIPVHVPDRDISQRRRASPAVVLGELGDGLRYMLHEPTVRMLLLLNFLLVIGTMPYQQMLPGFASDVLDSDAAGLGLLMAVQGVGALLGALVIASLPSRHRGLILLCSSALLGATLLLFAWSTWFWISAGILVVVGVGQAGRMSVSQALVQSYSASEYRGRVQSIFMMEMSLMQLSVFVVGLLANWIGPQIAIGGTAVLTLLVVAGAFLTPAMRRLQ